MTIEQDKIFASKICAGDKKAQLDFYQLICDELYNRADKLNNFGIREEFWEYRTKTGYSIKVDESVNDTFTWLWKRETKLTCKYKGLAPLLHLINHDIFSDLTRKNWIRDKRGKDAYVPTILKKEYSELHIKIFKQLTYKKTDEEIIDKLKIDGSIYYDYYDEIVEALKKAKMLRLIYPEEKIRLSEEPSATEIKDAPGFYTKNVSNDDSMLVKYLEDRIKRICLLLEKHDRRLLGLYWGYNYSPKEIFNFFSNGYPSYLLILKINKEKDIQSLISKITYKLFQYAKQTSKGFIEENNINEKKFRTLLKHHFLYKDPSIYN
jgi:hypothetical protein